MSSSPRAAKKQDEREPWPDWFGACLQAFRPPDTLTVSQCAARYQFIDRGRRYEHGLTPYLDEIQDSWTDPEVEEIWLRKPTQVGGTRVIFNILAYIILQDPDDTLVVYPTLDLARSTSVNRIQPMLEQTPALAALYLPNQSTDLELHFSNGMVLVLAGANSPPSLSSRSFRYVLLDEVAKFPSQAADDANPIGLSRERQKTFPHNRKLFGASSPKFETDNICRQAEKADQVREFHINCPHCGAELNFRFRSEDGKRRYLRWRDNSTPEQANETAYFECHDCQGRITDALKPDLVRTGQWLPVRTNGSGRRKLFYRMNTLPSPWVRFGEVAREYLTSKDDAEDLQNFVNGWLGEPWKDAQSNTSTNLVLERQTPLAMGELPREALLVSGGVDVQQGGYYYWVVRAWAPGMTSWGIAHGMALSWADVETIMNRPWRTQDGRELLVSLCCVDSGDGNTLDEVYDFCAKNSDWAVPSKGSSRQMTQRFRLSSVDRVESSAHGMRLVLVDTGQYKNMIAARMNRPNGRGAWMVHAETDDEYAESITSEHKVLGKHGVETWEPKYAHAPNHYLDAEVYCAVAADMMQVRYLVEESLTLDLGAPPPAPAPPPTGAGWVKPGGGDWMRR